MNHITEILDEKPLASLSEPELLNIRTHSEGCADCARAFHAAQLASVLLQERMSEAADQALTANPFFQTRVLAAWREQQVTGATWSLRRLWNATGALVSTMAVTTAALVVFTFVTPTTESTTQTTAALLPSTPESVVLNQDPDDLTNDQVLSAIYYQEDEDK
jgi:hypothetical protein